MHPDETYAKAAYEEYAVATGGKTWDGREMPKWDELPERIRMAWYSAAEKVIDTFNARELSA